MFKSNTSELGKMFKIMKSELRSKHISGLIMIKCLHYFNLF